jgi:hypothetical protein
MRQHLADDRDAGVRRIGMEPVPPFRGERISPQLLVPPLLTSARAISRALTGSISDRRQA